MEHTHYSLRRSAAFVLCILVMLLSIVNATKSSYAQEQESEEVEQTETLTLEEFQKRVIAQQWAQRKQRVTSFDRELSQHVDTLRTLHENRDLQTRKRAANRQMCRNDLRRASKFTKFSTTLDCYREELAWQLDILEQERAMISVKPGLSDDIRALALTRADLFADAISVMINAIDGEVYETVEELKTAKRSLRENYREPYWLILSRMRADTLLTWNANVMTQILELTEEDGLRESERAHLFDALACLSDSEQQLQSIVSAQSIDLAHQQLLGSHGAIEECISIVRDGYMDRLQEKRRLAREEQEKKQAQVDAFEEEKSKLSRRVQRRLNGDFRIQGELEKVETEKIEEEAEVEEAAEEAVEDEETLKAAPDEVEAAPDTLSRRLRRRLGDRYRVLGEESTE